MSDEESNPLTPDRQLPDQVVLQILSYLQPIERLSVERVNVQWRQLVRQSLADQPTTHVSTVSVSSRRSLWCCHNHRPCRSYHSQSDRFRSIELSRLFDHIYDQKLAAAELIDDNFSGQIDLFDGFAARSGRQLFLDCLKKFGNAVRSIDFTAQKVDAKILYDISAVCPYIECLAFDHISVTKQEWRWFVQLHTLLLEHLHLEEHPNQGRRRIATPFRNNQNNDEDEERESRSGDETIDSEPELGIGQLLGVLADKDPRQIRIIILEISDFTGEIIESINRLRQPTNAFVQVQAKNVLHPFGDFVHHLTCTGELSFNIFTLATYRQLKSIEIIGRLERYFSDSVMPVNFAALVNLRINCFTGLIIDERATRWLSRCRFPQLKTFFLRRFRGMSQQNYSNLFQAMPKLKQLTLFYDLKRSVLVVPEPFPGVAAISRLNHVESFDLIIYGYPFLQWQGLFASIDAIEQIPTLRSFKLDVRIFDGGFRSADLETDRLQRAQQWRRMVGERIQLMRERRSDVDVRKKFYSQLDTPQGR